MLAMFSAYLKRCAPLLPGDRGSVTELAKSSQSSESQQLGIYQALSDQLEPRLVKSLACSPVLESAGQFVPGLRERIAEEHWKGLYIEITKEELQVEAALDMFRTKEASEAHLTGLEGKIAALRNNLEKVNQGKPSSFLKSFFKSDPEQEKKEIAAQL